MNTATPQTFSDEELRRHLRLGEDSHWEFKQIKFAGDKPKSPRPHELADEFAAFANTDGGTVLCGVPRTHNVVALLNLIVPVLPAWDRWRDDFSQFTKHAVDARSPGHFATATDTDAANAMRICTEVRQAVRALLMPRR